MRHKILAEDFAVEPPAVVLMERRRAPERRTGWRGGRRDSDWHRRPEGGLDRISDRASRFAWRAWFKSR